MSLARRQNSLRMDPLKMIQNFVSHMIHADSLTVHLN
jgi:hypothetical protein